MATWFVFILTTLLATALAQAQPPKLKGGARRAHSAGLRATGLKVREGPQGARRATPDRLSSSAAQVYGKYCSNPAHAESFVCIKHNMRGDLVKASKDDQLKIAEDQARKLGNFIAADRRTHARSTHTSPLLSTP